MQRQSPVAKRDQPTGSQIKAAIPMKTYEELEAELETAVSAELETIRNNPDLNQRNDATSIYRDSVYRVIKEKIDSYGQELYPYLPDAFCLRALFHYIEKVIDSQSSGHPYPESTHVTDLKQIILARLFNIPDDHLNTKIITSMQALDTVLKEQTENVGTTLISYITKIDQKHLAKLIYPNKLGDFLKDKSTEVQRLILINLIAEKYYEKYQLAQFIALMNKISNTVLRNQIVTQLMPTDWMTQQINVNLDNQNHHLASEPHQQSNKSNNNQPGYRLALVLGIVAEERRFILLNDYLKTLSAEEKKKFLPTIQSISQLSRQLPKNDAQSLFNSISTEHQTHLKQHIKTVSDLLQLFADCHDENEQQTTLKLIGDSHISALLTAENAMTELSQFSQDQPQYRDKLRELLLRLDQLTFANANSTFIPPQWYSATTETDNETAQTTALEQIQHLWQIAGEGWSGLLALQFMQLLLNKLSPAQKISHILPKIACPDIKQTDSGKREQLTIAAITAELDKISQVDLINYFKDMATVIEFINRCDYAIDNKPRFSSASKQALALHILTRCGQQHTRTLSKTGKNFENLYNTVMLMQGGAYMSDDKRNFIIGMFKLTGMDCFDNFIPHLQNLDILKECLTALDNDTENKKQLITKLASHIEALPTPSIFHSNKIPVQTLEQLASVLNLLPGNISRLTISKLFDYKQLAIGFDKQHENIKNNPSYFASALKKFFLTNASQAKAFDYLIIAQLEKFIAEIQLQPSNRIETKPSSSSLPGLFSSFLSTVTPPEPSPNEIALTQAKEILDFILTVAPEQPNHDQVFRQLCSTLRVQDPIAVAKLNANLKTIIDELILLRNLFPMGRMQLDFTHLPANSEVKSASAHFEYRMVLLRHDDDSIGLAKLLAGQPVPTTTLPNYYAPDTYTHTINSSVMTGAKVAVKINGCMKLTEDLRQSMYRETKTLIDLIYDKDMVILLLPLADKAAFTKAVTYFKVNLLNSTSPNRCIAAICVDDTRYHFRETRKVSDEDIKVACTELNIAHLSTIERSDKGQSRITASDVTGVLAAITRHYFTSQREKVANTYCKLEPEQRQISTATATLGAQPQRLAPRY